MGGMENYGFKFSFFSLLILSNMSVKLGIIDIIKFMVKFYWVRNLVDLKPEDKFIGFKI